MNCPKCGAGTMSHDETECDAQWQCCTMALHDGTLQEAEYCLCNQRDQLKARVEQLEIACKAALYLVGNDADRRLIGERPWLPGDATHVPEMLRKALQETTQ